MPSPIAHCSLVLAFWPAVQRGPARGLSALRRLLLAAALVAALMCPDFDIACGLLLGQRAMDYHNGPTHSLLVAAAFALPFGLFCRLIAGRGTLFFAVIGSSAYAVHVLLDACTWGRGVQMFWPLSDARIDAPLPLFLGVRHSGNASLGMHLLTVASELLFAGLLWWVVRRLGLLRRSEATVSSRQVTAHPRSEH